MHTQVKKREDLSRAHSTAPRTADEQGAHVVHFSGKDGAVRVRVLEVDYQIALRACLEGRFTEELRDLFRLPFRERVPWHLFPNWARPVDPVEEGHDGGSI